LLASATPVTALGRQPGDRPLHLIQHPSKTSPRSGPVNLRLNVWINLLTGPTWAHTESSNPSDLAQGDLSPSLLAAIGRAICAVFISSNRCLTRFAQKWTSGL